MTSLTWVLEYRRCSQNCFIYLRAVAHCFLQPPALQAASLPLGKTFWRPGCAGCHQNWAFCQVKLSLSCSAFCRAAVVDYRLHVNHLQDFLEMRFTFSEIPFPQGLQNDFWLHWVAASAKVWCSWGTGVPAHLIPVIPRVDYSPWCQWQPPPVQQAQLGSTMLCNPQTRNQLAKVSLRKKSLFS